MHMTSLVKSSLNGLSGSCSEAVAEGARSAAGETTLEAVRRDPEVVAIARRRQFSGSETLTNEMQPKLLNQTRLLANLMTKGVSKSLTRSGRARPSRSSRGPGHLPHRDRGL